MFTEKKQKFFNSELEHQIQICYHTIKSQLCLAQKDIIIQTYLSMLNVTLLFFILKNPCNNVAHCNTTPTMRKAWTKLPCVYLFRNVKTRPNPSNAIKCIF